MKKPALLLLCVILLVGLLIFNSSRNTYRAKQTEVFSELMSGYLIYSGENIVDKNLDLQKSSHEDNPCLKNTDIQYLDKFPSSRKLVVLTRVAVCITDDQGAIVLNTTAEKLTNNKEVGFNYAEISPDGKSIILGRNWSNSTYIYDYLSKEITKIDLPQTKANYDDQVFFGNINWGKDEQVYFGASGSKIKSLNTKTKEISTIVDNAYSPSVSKNGKLLAYLSKTYIYVMELETKKIVKEFNREGDKYFPELGYFNWVGDNHILISGNDEVRAFCTGVNSSCHDTFLYLYSVKNNELKFIKRWDDLTISPFKATKL